MYEELLIGLRGHAKRHGCDDRCPYYDAEYRGYATCSEELAEKAADAIEQLQKSICPHYIRNVHDRGDDSLCRKFRCEVNALPRWIPVTERLPEIKEYHVSDTVLVYLDDGGMSFSELEENIFGQVWFDIERPSPDGESDSTVTHWMPLPEPPKEEQT